MTTTFHLGALLARAYAENPSLPIEECHIGPDAAQRLASFAKAKCASKALVVFDENTHRAAGNAPFNALKAAGKTIVEKRFPKTHIDATDTLGDEVADAGADCDFFVAIGSGTLCDLAKHAGTKLGRPVLLYATAASMNGYTSGITAIKVKGLKRTVPCRPATAVFADPRIIAEAPQRMTAAGVADFLSKCSAGADWRTAHILREEYYDESALQFYEGILEQVLESANRVGKGDPGSVGIVMEALLLSGLSMLVAGSSSPASGGEHLLSHYLDMKQAIYGTQNDLHGIQVGVGTIHCLRLWEKVTTLDPKTLQIENLVAEQPAPEQIEQWIRNDWGDVADEVLKQWSQKARTPDALRAELSRFADKAAEICESVQKDLLPSTVVEEAIAAAGGPTRIENTLASVTEYRNALSRARYIRNRFTILDLAAELGIM